MDEWYLFLFVTLLGAYSAGFWKKEIDMWEIFAGESLRKWAMEKISGKMVNDLLGLVKNIFDEQQ